MSNGVDTKTCYVNRVEVQHVIYHKFHAKFDDVTNVCKQDLLDQVLCSFYILMLHTAQLPIQIETRFSDTRPEELK